MSKEKKYLYLDFGLKPNGKRNRKKITYYTQAELTRKIKEAQKKQNENIINGNTTVEVWCNKWAETFLKPTVSEQWYKDCISRINIINQFIGYMAMNDVKLTNLQAIINSQSGKSKSHIKKVYNLIRKIFHKAYREEIISKDISEDLEQIPGYQKERRALTKDEIHLLEDVAYNHQYGIMFMTMLKCGLRPQEIRALTWNNIDFNKNLIHIKSAVKAGTMKVDTTKSKAGIRSIPIPIDFVDKLKGIKKSSIYVFPAPVKKGIMQAKRFESAWKSVLRQMDIKAGAKLYRNKIIEHKIDTTITPYNLRHTYITNLIEKGIDVKTVQYLAGHATAEMTLNVYTHVTDEMIDNAIMKINNINQKQDAEKLP